MVKSNNIWPELNRPDNFNDITSSSDDFLTPTLKLDQQKVSLDDEVKLTIRDFNRLLYGYFLRFIILVVLYFFFFMIYRATILLTDVYYYDDKLERFLDRIHETIDDRHLEFLKKLSDGVYYTFIVILLLRFLLFYPVIFNIQLLLRFSSIYVFTLLVRSLSIIFTTIPSPYPYCVPLVKAETSYKTFAKMLIFKKDQVPCVGLLFSPKAFVVILGVTIFAQNTHFIHNILMFIFAAFVLVSLAASKLFYSIDVMFSLLLSVIFYYFYFTRIDTYAVQYINNINTKFSGLNQQLRQTVLETSIVNKWVASVEQISMVLVLGYRIKRLQVYVSGNDEIDPKLIKRFNIMVFLFGLDDCKDVLTLYRGSSKFNFSYFKKIKCKFIKVKPIMQSMILN